MKHNCLYILLLTVSAACLSACSDWFDIRPKTNVKAEDLFTTETGFNSALAGIYVSMTDQSAYGKNFTFGILDQMVQYYDYVPSNINDRSTIFNYDTNDNAYNTKSKIAEMWAKSYNLIANTNNLLSWLDKNGAQVIRNKNDLNMLRGEALALRAFFHFDLLRLWGPMYRTDSTKVAIPYRLVTDGRRLPLLPANKVVEHIMSDLSQARTLLAFEKETPLNNSKRQYRMNYFAVTALMARVANYRGDSESAFNYAQEVVEKSNLSLLDNVSDGPALFGETLFAINMYKMSDNLSDSWSAGPSFNTQLVVSLTNLANIFETTGVGANDMRAKRGSAFLAFDNTNEAISRKYLQNERNEIPIIRLPEMYYILCENAPIEQSARYLNTVRQKRGISSSNNYIFSDSEARINALDLEYRKEFYAEGQYFHFLKLHARTTYLNCPVADGMTKKQYIFPLPDREKEYGWTDSMENKEN